MRQSKPVEEQKSTYLYLVVVLLLTFLIAARTPLDGDMWWHLRSGQVTLQDHSVLLEDEFSFTRNGQSWINHSWLGQVILYFSFDHFGYAGLSLCVTLAVVIGFYLISLQTGGVNLFTSFVLLLGALTASTVWSPRPQIFSLFCFSICSYLLFLFRENGSKKLWLFLPLFVIWSNLHGGYPLGLMLMGLVFAGEILNKLLIEKNPHFSKKDWKLVFWLILSFVVVLINPNGFNMWKIPFQTLDVSVLQELISEWASPDFHKPITWLFLIFLFSGYIFMSLSRQKKDYVDILIFTWFALMALMARRNFGPFVYAGIPIICKYGRDYLTQIKSRVQELAETNRFLKSILSGKETKQPSENFRKFFNLSLTAMLALAAFVKLTVVSHPVLVSFYESQLFPKEAVVWLEKNEQTGNVLNEYNWGGYLIWRLPEYKVFVDGRTDLFGDEILGEWLSFLEGGEKLETFLKRWDVDYVLLQPDRRVVSGLLESGWEKVYEDEQAVILQP